MRCETSKLDGWLNCKQKQKPHKTIIVARLPRSPCALCVYNAFGLVRTWNWNTKNVYIHAYENCYSKSIENCNTFIFSASVTFALAASFGFESPDFFPATNQFVQICNVADLYSPVDFGGPPNWFGSNMENVNLSFCWADILLAFYGCIISRDTWKRVKLQ